MMLQFLLESNIAAGLNCFFSDFLGSERSCCGALVFGGSRLYASVHLFVWVRFMGGNRERSSEVDWVCAVMGFVIELCLDRFSLAAGYCCEFWCKDCRLDFYARVWSYRFDLPN